MQLTSIRSYETELANGLSSSKLHADFTEQGTIDFMIQGVARIFDSKTFSLTAERSERLRNFASFISEEETVPASYKMAVRISHVLVVSLEC